jgi:hypothetical protein
LAKLHGSTDEQETYCALSLCAQNADTVAVAVQCPKILGIAHVGYFAADFDQEFRTPGMKSSSSVIPKNPLLKKKRLPILFHSIRIRLIQ